MGTVFARRAEGAVAQHAAGVPDVCACLATTRSGCHVALETAWNLPEGFAPNIDFFIEIIGDEGAIQTDLFPHDLNVYGTDARSIDHTFGVSGHRGCGVGWWQESVRYFVDGVLGGDALRPTVEEGFAVTRALLAAERSLRSEALETVT